MRVSLVFASAFLSRFLSAFASSLCRRKDTHWLGFRVSFFKREKEIGKKGCIKKETVIVTLYKRFTTTMLRRARSTTSTTRSSSVWRKWSSSLVFPWEKEEAVSRVSRRFFYKTSFSQNKGVFDGIGGGSLLRNGGRRHPSPCVDYWKKRNRTSSDKSYSTETSSSDKSSDKSSWFAPIIGTLGVALGCVTLGMEHQKRTERALREAAATATQTTTTTESTPPTRSEKKKEKKESNTNTSSHAVKSEADLLFNLHNKARTVFVTGTIDDRLSHRVVAQLVHLNNENPKSPIVMVINSGGGVVTSGYAILDTMKALEAPIVTFAVGHAESMAAILLASGEKGRRFCAPNARIMIHQPHHSMSGMTSDILIKATKAEETRNALTMSLVEMTGKTFDEVEKALDRNTYLFAESAKQFGIVDRVCVNWKDLTTTMDKDEVEGEAGKEKKKSAPAIVSSAPRVNGARGIGQQQKKEEETKKQTTATTKTKTTTTTTKETSSSSKK